MNHNIYEIVSGQNNLNSGLYCNIGWFSIFFVSTRPYNIPESGLGDRKLRINHLPRLKKFHLNLILTCDIYIRRGKSVWKYRNCSAELNTIEGLLERAITGLEEHQPVRKVNIKISDNCKWVKVNPLIIG